MKSAHLSERARKAIVWIVILVVAGVVDTMVYRGILAPYRGLPEIPDGPMVVVLIVAVIHVIVFMPAFINSIAWLVERCHAWVKAGR